MDNSNYDDVIELAESQEHKQKVQLILDELFPNEKVDVPDPYFGLPNGFEIVYNMLDEVCDVIAKKLIDKHQ
jgi:protein-tyrosine phosphatase